MVRYLTQEEINFVKDHENDFIHDLALKYNKRVHSHIDLNLVLNQIKGRQIIKNKVPSWYKNELLLYPSQLSLEQSSSEATANYKTSLIKNLPIQTFVDLTGGFGVDFYFLAKNIKKNIYVEKDEKLCSIVKHNMEQLDLQNYDIINNTASEFLEKSKIIDFIYLDPARRDVFGRKTYKIEDCMPNILFFQDNLHLKSKVYMIKYSPMLDISAALNNLQKINEVHIVSLNNECKELLFFHFDNSIQPVKMVAVNLRDNEVESIFTFTPDEERVASVTYTKTIYKYLYEPNSSIMKAAPFKSVSSRFNLYKLHPNSHLYSSDELIINFPGRCFEVIYWFKAIKSNVKQLMSRIKKANITVRNYPESVEEIRKKTKIKEGGEVYIFASINIAEEQIWIVCKKKL